MDRCDVKSYFICIAGVVSTRSTCIHRQVGAVIVRDNHILTTGYNGAPSGIVHCNEGGGCLRDGVQSGTMHEKCRAVHAEQNAIIQASLHGVSISGATIYCTHQPCVLCAKMLINAGICKVVYRFVYPDDSAIKYFKEAGVEVEEYTGLF